MPSLGADMTAGTLAKWRVAVGDSVSHGDIIAEVETDKGLIEVEVFETGVIEKLLVQEGAKVPVGTALAEIGSGAPPLSVSAPAPVPGPAAAPAPAPAPAPVPGPLPVAVAVQPPGSILSAGSSRPAVGGPMASPAVRRRAHELDVALQGVRGSGDHGRITLDDVQGAAQAKAPPAPAGDRMRISPYARRVAMERGVDLRRIRGTGPGGAIQSSDVLGAEPQRGEAAEPVSAAERMQRAIAAAMSRANNEIPHYYVEHTIDMGNALAWLRDANASLGVNERLVSGVLVLRAVALALRKHKQLNATWQGGQAVPSAGVHVGLAVSLRGGGLVAPALRNTDQGSLADLMARMTDLVSRARAGALRSSEMTSATITLTALGERGVESVTPIIFPPQVAIVGCGATIDRPWVLDGRVVVRPVMRVTLGGDHRVSNGHEGARFLGTLERLLQEPEKL
jgi:pyruvate dehydrogenase E2 component (dihydrolipoamide acetyltransferase)